MEDQPTALIRRPGCPDCRKPMRYALSALDKARPACDVRVRLWPHQRLGSLEPCIQAQVSPQPMTVAKDIQENLKVLASAITTISAVLGDEKLENAPTRDRAELLVHVAASLRDMAAALGTTAQLLEKLAAEGGD
jgi:hypothetical protein